MKRSIPSFGIPLIFLTAVIWVSCSSSTDSSASTPDQLIVGDWNWIESTGGIAGVTLTPAIVGYTQKRLYNGNGVAYFYRDTTLVATWSYIVELDTSSTQKEEWKVRYTMGSHDMEESISFPAPDSLVLAEEYADGFVHLFSRIR